MKKELEYSELNYTGSSVPEPMKNAGLYTGDVLFDKKPWGNNYLQPKIPPDAVSYASQFYATHHIPTYNRPGNNTVNLQSYKIYKDPSKYNISCHS
ncbi:hypothetical protein [Flavobacterium sp.]|jgi:hypothetical protein|uniref:hypothetical protein n=1 Tax=Flavobacterium sp. TaxID=239 RepID=UPI0037C195F2